MLKNYLTIALRNIVRNKLFSTLNILGLAIGMGSAILIFLWVNDELKVDQFHEQGAQLYRVMENQQYTDGKLFTFSSTPGPMAPFIKDKYPEIERATRFSWPVNNLFTYGDKSFYDNGRYADQDFLDMFSFALVAGNKSIALKEKNSIVINETMAEKYFGKEEAIGKTIIMNTKDSYVVTAVVKNISKRSSISFTYLLPFQVFFEQNKSWLDQWGNNNIRTFIQLAKDVDLPAFQSKFKDEIKEHEKDSNVELFVQPYQEMYLYGDFENGKQAGGRIEYVRIFLVVAVFVLLIACINFMNLSTAQAGKRAKEVGLRKVAGAFPRQLFRQFMGESFVTVSIAALIALFLVALMIPSFNELTGKEIGVQLLDKNIVYIVLGVIAATSLLAGSYPAFIISEFKPVQVLKGQLKSGTGAFMFRKVLVVTQFFLSILGIISTIVVYRQMNFMQNRDIGFDRDNVFYVWMDGDVNPKFDTFRERLLQSAGVESVTASTQLPIDIGNSTYGLQWEGMDPNSRILFSNLDVDFDFIQTMKMTMVEGRSFDRAVIADTINYIVNEVAAEKFGFKNGTAGQDLTMWERKGKIVGVVKNFNFGSLHSPIEPLVMRVKGKYASCLLVRSKANQNEAAISSTERLWKEYAAGYPFKYSFLNQDWEGYYKSEQQRGKVFNAMSGMSIFISCLGLFGLSAFSAERRTKELGIRKVMGASVNGLVALMGKEFALLVLIASAIGCPLGWYLMNGWLQNYAYHVEVGWGTLTFAMLFCISIALFTVSYHAIRVAISNPAKAIRYE
jgi:ABC-type antimicrobial peptide transport system permease subunit